MSTIRVEVEADVRGEPRRFRHRGRWHQIAEIKDSWEEVGCWWQGETPRRVFQVLTAEGGAYELHYQPSTGWQLASSMV